jgi:hypothetical protein
MKMWAVFNVFQLFKTYDTWKLTQPMDRNRFQPNTDGFDLVKVKWKPVIY